MIELPETLFTRPLFVYGTLRVGEGNYKWVDPCVIEYEENVRTPGHLWFVRPGWYPVAKFWSRGTPDHIIGDLLWCDTESDIFMDMVRMELAAGYEPREIRVQMQNGAEQDAVGFHYLDTPNPDYFIPGGDWRAAVREEVM